MPELRSPTGRQTFRRRVIEAIARQFQISTHLVLLEAQAGQGKTTAARQFAHFHRGPSIWYSLTVADHDPVVLLSGLHASFSRSVPGFRAQLLEEVLEKGTITPAEHPRAVDMLIEGLGHDGKEECYLIIDDIHLLEPQCASATLLRRLTESKAEGLHLLLLSREPVFPILGITGESRLVGRLENPALAFTAAEIAELYATTFDLSLRRADVAHLARFTEGWAMGLALLASSLPEGGRLDWLPEGPLAALHGGQIPDYFRAQLVNRLPERERIGLLELSLLDTIPMALGERLTPNLDLDTLVERNFFLRRMEGDPDRYVFHHLFHDSLRRLAGDVLSDERHQAVLGEAARWHQIQGESGRALHYLLRSGAYAQADRVARENGLELMARNRTVTVHDLLHHLAEEVLSAYPWLAYLYAVSSFNTDPPKAYGYLQKAQERFSQQKDGVGELLATSQLMYFHMTVDAHYQRVLPLLERATKLFRLYGDALSAPMQVQCAQYLSFANAQTDRDMDEAADYSAFALRLAEKHGLTDAVANISVGRGYEGSLRGDWIRFAKNIEYAYPLQSSPRVTAFTKFLMHFTQANLLHHLGDFMNYRHQRERLERMLSGNLFARTICRPLLATYDADMAMAEGRNEDAARILDEALHGDHASTSPHMRSQFLHYRACIAALRGDRNGVEADAAEAIRLRAEAGHPYHKYRNHLLVGHAYARIGEQKKAEYHIELVLAYAERQGVHSFKPLAWFLLAWLRLAEDDIPEALKVLGQALGYMRQHNYMYFFGWEPGMMRRLLAIAVAHGVEADYARRLAAERLDYAVLGNGETIPRMKIHTFGGLSLSVPGHGQINGATLSPTQRQLLALLITAPQGALSYDEIQLALWPDIAPGKVRARLDTNLARLRKTLAAAFGEIVMSHYLVLENKQLRLVHCHIDVFEFGRFARKGLTHARRREHWRAENAFRIAHSHWQGPFLPDLAGSDRYRTELTQLYISSAMAWIDTLVIAGSERDALEVATAAVCQQPTDPVLVGALYDLSTRTQGPASAQRVLREYEKALHEEGNTREEIAELMEELWEQRETA
ncbi:BTAD domain-containing putative transcriptional regulator [Thiohalomonas denitrificans]|uniref:Transcriptional regulatory protein, C terminal n=1 Tax=Thiohalomonas denitrificans TaxID=415747 RepID=A0A1G5QQ35_9GAMM|nr:BTAD domain-containing putative transcriptional regulator [Thiohalomonas denitrificans]SCZ63219.1 Transcriptional regulatory protein, C terminal [Thiohalomonas denitrificans]